MWQRTGAPPRQGSARSCRAARTTHVKRRTRPGARSSGGRAGSTRTRTSRRRTGAGASRASAIGPSIRRPTTPAGRTRQRCGRTALARFSRRTRSDPTRCYRCRRPCGRRRPSSRFIIRIPRPASRGFERTTASGKHRGVAADHGLRSSTRARSALELSRAHFRMRRMMCAIVRLTFYRGSIPCRNSSSSAKSLARAN